MEEEIDPVDVLTHPENYLLYGDRLKSIRVVARTEEGNRAESETLSWKCLIRKPRTRKVKARAYRYKDEPRPALVITEEEDRWSTLYDTWDIVWIGQEFEIEVGE